jgi:hypothetical protein
VLIPAQFLIILEDSSVAAVAIIKEEPEEIDFK